MIVSDLFNHRDFAVVGLGRSGRSAARALLASGARVFGFDDNADTRRTARADGLPVCDGADPPPPFPGWNRITEMVWSPGIPSRFPRPHPLAAIARDHHIPVVCDIDLLVRARPETPVIGITGTNGKSTTTALIGHILSVAGVPADVGGNLGRPALDFAPLTADGTYVLEMSSYQLELVPSLSPKVAVLLNITPDHLARHGGLDGYIEAKARLFARPAPDATALIGVDDPPSRSLADRVRAQGGWRVIPVSGTTLPKNGIGIREGLLVDDTDGMERAVLTLADAPALPGAHNAQNMAAAYGAAVARGLPMETIVNAIRSFPGLAHRQQTVADIAGVRFINDSKATNADATEKALSCYRDIYWILGGQAKEGGISALAPYFPRIRKAFLIGESAPLFRDTLGDAVPCDLCGTLDRAVTAAAKAAWADGRVGAVVLLSPAAASWDQFRSFEHRGDAFREQVLALKADPPPPANTSGGAS